MTEEQKIKIIELRNQGLGYKRIAKQLNIPIKTLERHITNMRKEGLL